MTEKKIKGKRLAEVVKPPEKKLVKYIALALYNPGGYEVFNADVSLDEMEQMVAALGNYVRQLKASVKVPDRNAPDEVKQALESK